ncbi:MAG: hypothetical protein U9R53_10060 [Chloroflexota bacterium]|nr:hypothetical protein [Chloroflexota bacterium]
MLAPRAPIRLGVHQYSWHEIHPKWPIITLYEEITDQLIWRIDTWLEEHQLNCAQLDAMGFSQEAILAYALAFLHQEKVRKMAALSGFIPQSWQKDLNNRDLKGKQIFIAHGNQDEIVPLNKARQSAAWLKEHGAQVTICEADIVHKVGVNCFKSLGAFFRSPT